MRRPTSAVLLAATAAFLALAGSGAAALLGDDADDGMAGEPVQTGESTTLADGPGWALTGYPSDTGLCLQLEVSGGTAGGCGYGVPDHLAVGQDVYSEPGRTFVFGITRGTVEAVEVTTVDGEAVTVATGAAPAGAFGGSRSYALVLERQVPVTSVKAVAP